MLLHFVRLFGEPFLESFADLQYMRCSDWLIVIVSAAFG